MFKVLLIVLVCEFISICYAKPIEDSVELEDYDHQINTNDDDEIIDLSRYGNLLYGQPRKSSGVKVANLNGTTNQNPEELGEYLEGDILFPRKSGEPQSRNGMANEMLRWENGVVPFEINGNFNAQQMGLIERAFMEYHSKTCIRFVRRDSTHRDFIRLLSGDTGCWSSVGRIEGEQYVNLQAPGCVTKIGTILHELMHALGFLHEHTREDRDKFVVIQAQNIMSGVEANFQKAGAGETNDFGVTYDMGSVLHYSSTAFSKNGEPTIMPKVNSPEAKHMGQRDGFSNSDIEKLNRMYKCSRTTSESGYKLNEYSQWPLVNVIKEMFPLHAEEDKEEML